MFALVGVGAGLAGGALWLSFALAGAVAALTGWAYAYLGPRFPRDSPEFQYVRAAFGARPGFLAGWLMLSADLVGASVVALTFGEYLGSIIGVSAALLALLLTLGALTLAWVGIRESMLLVNSTTVIVIGTLVILVLVSLPHWGSRSLLEAPHGIGGIWAGSSLIFFAFIGFDEIGNLAEEMGNPRRDIPRAVGFSLAGSTVLYIGVAVAAISLVGWPAVSGSDVPLVTVATAGLGPFGALAVNLVALLATAEVMVLLVIAISRSLYGMAQAGALPRALSAVGRRRTPWAGVLAVGGIVGVLVLLGNLTSSAELANFTILASFLMVNLSAARVASRERSVTAGARSTATRAIVLAGVACGTCVLLAVQTGPTAWLEGGVIAIGGTALAWRLPPAGR